jgi:hypothetical protein
VSGIPNVVAIAYAVFKMASVAVALLSSVSFIISRKIGIYFSTGWSLLSIIIFIVLLLRREHTFLQEDIFLVIGLGFNSIMVITSTIYIWKGIEKYVDPYSLNDSLEDLDIEPLPMYQRKDPATPPDYNGGSSIALTELTDPVEQSGSILETSSMQQIGTIGVIVGSVDTTSRSIDTHSGLASV